MLYLIKASKSDYLALCKNVALLKEKKKESDLCLADMRGIIEVTYQIHDAEKNWSQWSDKQRKEAEAQIYRKLSKVRDIGVKLSSYTRKSPKARQENEAIAEEQLRTKQIPDKQQPMEQLLEEQISTKQSATTRKVEPADPHHITIEPQKPTAEEVNKTSKNIIRMEYFLNSHYKLRHNEITDQTEYKEIGSEEPFAKMTNRVLHAMCTDVRKRGIDAWDKDIIRHTESKYVEDYHPMKGYIKSLPKWDGKDRVTPLAERVSKSEYWIKHFHTWMRGVAAQWMGQDTLHGNSVAPILISKRQGRQKSTFCKLLLPDELQAYYMDRLNINSTARAEEKLAEFALINLDEIDKYSTKGMASLKNLMQIAEVNTKKAYQKGLSRLSRTASFIATSNRRDLLTDPTGSRRFICIEVDKKIDCSSIDHAQIYAQLKEEIEAGKRYWFEEDEEAEIMEHNKVYQHNTIEEDVFYTLFRKPTGNEKTNVIKLSAREIYDEMRATDKEAMKGVKESKIWNLLRELDLHKEHYEDGNKYDIVRR